MASYVIPTKPTSYKDAAKQSDRYKSPEPEVIEPTYTEIDWETKMQNLRNEIIKECKSHTEALITKQVNKHKEEMSAFMTLVQTEQKNEET